MSEGKHTEVQPQQPTGKKTPETIITQKTEEKSIFQEIWERFKEGVKKLLGNADEKLEPVNKRAEEISEKTKTEGLRDYFKIQIENLKDGIQAGVYDIYGVFYDIGVGVSQAKVAFWHNFMGGMMQNYLRENRENVKNRKQTAEDYYLKAKTKAKENQKKRDKLREKAKGVREKKAAKS